MRILQLLKITQKKYKVVLEDGISFPLYAGEIRRYRIEQDGELSEQELSLILDEVVTRRAKLRCLNLLRSMDRTEAQLRERLSRDGYPGVITDRAIAYASSFHYIDDRRYAENYIRQQSGKKSRRQILYALMQKGIRKELVSEIMESFFSEADGSEDPDASVIRSLARKRHFDPDTADEDQSRRFIQYLMRRGFRLPEIREALSAENGREPFPGMEDY